MFKRSIALTALLALTACATPREQCIYEAQSELGQVNRQITVIQDNLVRGYAIRTHRELVDIEVACAIPNGDGTSSAGICDDTEWVETQVPAEIDVPTERARLAQLIARQEALQNASAAAVQQCIAIHPE